MASLPDGKKKFRLFENIFTHSDRIHERDRHQADGQTPHDDTGPTYA